MKKIFASLALLLFIVLGCMNVTAAPITNVSEIDTTKTYIFYIDGKNQTIFDDGGNAEGWIRYGNFDDSDKYSFELEKTDDKFYFRNKGTKYPIKENMKDIKGTKYMVSDKNNSDTKMKLTIEPTNNGNTFYIKDSKTNQYVRIGKDRNYVTFTAQQNEAGKFTIEETPPIPPYPYPDGSLTLFDNPIIRQGGRDFYRIPAITTTNSGRVIAVTDYRYNHDNDLGNHKIDLHVKYSDDNGKTWSESNNITSFNNKNNFGYGDAAIVADRESNNVLLIGAYGTQSYFNSKRNNPIKVARFISNDNGETWSEPVDLTEQIYGLNDRFDSLFVAAGRIHQSRYIKVGDYYRLYLSILERTTGGNYVLYSDDFGVTWKALGGTEKSPVPGGDEAKVEELPNGSVVISSRTGNGRFINVFTFEDGDNTYTKGSWGSRHKKVNLGNARGTNGEILVVYAWDTKKNKPVYLMLQSIPTLKGARFGVGIYYKELKPDSETIDDVIANFGQDKFYMIQERASAYSTMTVQDDGNIGFLYEDTGRASGGGYDIQYVNLPISKITNGRYEKIFTGIGSKDKPYTNNDENLVRVLNTYFSKEKMNFSLAYENLTSDASTQTDTIETKEIAIQTDNAETKEIAIQTDNAETKSSSTQTENTETREFSTQTDDLEQPKTTNEIATQTDDLENTDKKEETENPKGNDDIDTRIDKTNTTPIDYSKYSIFNRLKDNEYFNNYLKSLKNKNKITDMKINNNPRLVLENNTDKNTTNDTTQSKEIVIEKTNKLPNTSTSEDIILLFSLLSLSLLTIAILKKHQ